MKRVLRIFAVLTLLGVPMVTSADDTTIPPQMNWTATPPARGTAEMARMSELLANLINKGAITAQDQAQLAQPFVEIPLGDGRRGAEELMLEYLQSP